MICDIYAGAVAFKLKLNNEYLLERKKELNKFIYLDERSLNTGFDEILLLDLFKSFTTYDIDVNLKLKLINSSKFNELFDFDLNNLEFELLNKYFNLTETEEDEIIILVNKFKYCLYNLFGESDNFDKLAKLNLNEFLDNLPNLDNKTYVLFLIEYIICVIVKPTIIHYVCLRNIGKFISTSNYTIYNMFSTYMINSTISYEYKDIFNFYKINYDEIKHLFI